MKRKDFLKTSLAFAAMGTLGGLKAFSDTLPGQRKRMPVLFTSHGSPMDIPVAKEDRPFWMALHDLGRTLEKDYELKAVLVVSAHWCTNHGTYVNISPEQEQIYDYYGFPKEYYDVYYQAKGAPGNRKRSASSGAIGYGDARLGTGSRGLAHADASVSGGKRTRISR